MNDNLVAHWQAKTQVPMPSSFACHNENLGITCRHTTELVASTYSNIQLSLHNRVFTSLQYSWALISTKQVPLAAATSPGLSTTGTNLKGHWTAAITETWRGFFWPVNMINWLWGWLIGWTQINTYIQIQILQSISLVHFICIGTLCVWVVGDVWPIFMTNTCIFTDKYEMTGCTSTMYSACVCEGIIHENVPHIAHIQTCNVWMQVK